MLEYIFLLCRNPKGDRIVNRIAVLLTSYNGDTYITELLYSLENQGYNNFDLFIRDDGSSDQTLKQIHDFLSKSKLSITVLPKGNNLGASQNFAYLLQYTLKHNDYDYFMFCDQDDVWLPDKIAYTMKGMEKAEASYPAKPILVHTDLQVVDENLDIREESYWSYQNIDPSYDQLNHLLVQNVITGCTVMINRPLAKAALPVPKNVIMHDWWLGLIAAAGGEIVCLPKSTIKYRQHGSNDIGASAFNLSTIMKNARSLISISLNKYIIQAQSFLYYHSDILDPKQKRMLEAFVSIENIPWYKGKMILLKYKILKQHWIRNVGLLLCK